MLGQKGITKFQRLHPTPQPNLVKQTLNDPYISDFLTLQEPFRERELATNLRHQLERFLLKLGQCFTLVGRQSYLKVGNCEFHNDLLFYHSTLRSFVVIDLKDGDFKSEYAGKMNFYLSVVDDQRRHNADAASIGLILCQDRKHIVAEYALRGLEKPIGISEYELALALPPSLKSTLPTIEEVEVQLVNTADSIETPSLTTATNQSKAFSKAACRKVARISIARSRKTSQRKN